MFQAIHWRAFIKAVLVVVLEQTGSGNASKDIADSQPQCVRHSRKSGNLEIGRFSRSAAARRPLLHLESPVRASKGSPGKLGQELGTAVPLSRRPGSGEGGHLLPSGESRVSLFSKHFSARSVIFANEPGVPPHPSPLPQHKKRVGGEGTNCGNADPWRHQRLLPLMPPWAIV